MTGRRIALLVFAAAMLAGVVCWGGGKGGG
jgi:hypothetical protein